MKSMKKVLCALAVAALLMAACNSKAKKQAQEAAEIQRIDSTTAVMENLNDQIDFTAQEVDKLINEL
jgi:outer membrane murein-binding lipoprotein Lpp